MDKKIFSYHDGAKECKIDPIEAHRELVMALHPECAGDLSETCTLARTHDDKGERIRPDSQAFKYRGYLVEAFRKAFNLPRFNPLTGEGVLEDQVWEIMDGFFAFQVKKKESIEPLPTSASPLECPGPSATTNTMASGSTPHAA